MPVGKRIPPPFNKEDGFQPISVDLQEQDVPVKGLWLEQTKPGLSSALA